MTDDPGADYDRHCREQDEREDPCCEDCDGVGCEECGGSGRARDAAKIADARREADLSIQWADEMGSLFDPAALEEFRGNAAEGKGEG